MFPYSDPTQSGALEAVGALEIYRQEVDRQYRFAAELAYSAFTYLEAIADLPDPQQIHASISWRAFPITAGVSDDQIDKDRFRFQDEYMEWSVERGPTGDIQRVIFTTEFPEYYEALAEVSSSALVDEIARIIPAAQPTAG